MIERRKLFGNTVAILINRLTQSITTFVLIASIARFLGPYVLGQYTLAFNFYFLFMTVGSQGFKTLFTRELSRDSKPISQYLVSGSLLQLIVSILAYGGLTLIVLLMPYGHDTTFFCLLLGLAIIPFSLSNVTEAIFQAQEKMYLISISAAPIYLVRLVVMLGGMLANRGLLFICLTLLGSELLILAIQWSLLLRLVRPRWQVNWRFMQDTLRMAWTFLVIEGIAVFKGRMLVIVLSLFTDETVVGLYGSLLQLLQPFEIVAHSLVVATFPSMTKAAQLGGKKQQHFAQLVIKLLLCVAVPIIIGLSFIGSDLLVLIYGDAAFSQGGRALQIAACSLGVIAFTRPLGYTLVANGFERINLIEVGAVSVLGFGMSLFFVPSYGLMGAAITLLLMEVITALTYTIFVSGRLFRIQFQKIVVWPGLMSLGTFITFHLLDPLEWHLSWTIAIASLAYGLQAGTLTVRELGGPRGVWSRWRDRSNQASESK